MADANEPVYGVRFAGATVRHIVGRELSAHRAEALCGRFLTIWPLVETSMPVCTNCDTYALAARFASKEIA